MFHLAKASIIDTVYIKHKKVSLMIFPVKSSETIFPLSQNFRNNYKASFRF